MIPTNLNEIFQFLYVYVIVFIGAYAHDYYDSVTDKDAKIYVKRLLFMSFLIALGIIGIQPKFIEMFGDSLIPFLSAMMGWSNQLFYGLFDKIGNRAVKEVEKEVNKK